MRILKLPAKILYYVSDEFNKTLKLFSYVFLYKSLQGLAQINRTWLSLIVGYGFWRIRRLKVTTTKMADCCMGILKAYL